MDKIIKNKEESGIGFWNLWWKPVLSQSGEYSGRVVNIIFQSGKVVNIILFYKFRFIKIDSSFIRNFSVLDKDKKIILNIEPIYLLKGRFVYDSEGKKLGRVSKILQLGYHNDYDGIDIKKKFYLPAESIPKSKLKVVQKNIILNESYAKAK